MELGVCKVRWRVSGGYPVKEKERRQDWEPWTTMQTDSPCQLGISLRLPQKGSWPQPRGWAVLKGHSWRQSVASHTWAAGMIGLPWVTYLCLCCGAGVTFYYKCFYLKEKEITMGRDCGCSQITLALGMGQRSRGCLSRAEQPCSLSLPPFLFLQIPLAGGQADYEASRACSPTTT